MLHTLGTPHCDDSRFPSFCVVAYHDNCTDGLAAAAVVSLAVESAGDAQPEFIPVQYGQALPERILVGGKCILFVDFCPEREQIAQIAAVWEDWFAIDHHKHRAWLPVEFPNNAAFDIDRSGAVLTSDWFFGRQPTCNIFEPWVEPHQDAGLPTVLRYVQDRDLWKWEMPNSREVSAALAEEPRTVERWREIIYAENLENWRLEGVYLLKSRTRSAKSKASKAFATQTLAGIPFRAVNATEHMSEVGEEILAAFPDIEVACAFFQAGPDTMQLSFRSRAHQPGKFTALAAAVELGGGGHEHAAGARMPLDDWPHFLRGQIAVRLP